MLQAHSQRHYLLQHAAVGDQDAIDFLKGVSPVAWRNINLIGNIEFTGESSKVDIEALAARFNDPNFWRKSLKDEEDN